MPLYRGSEHFDGAQEISLSDLRAAPSSSTSGRPCARPAARKAPLPGGLGRAAGRGQRRRGAWHRRRLLHLLGDRPQSIEFLETIDLTYPVGEALDRSIIVDYGVQGMPTTVIHQRRRHNSPHVGRRHQQGPTAGGHRRNPAVGGGGPTRSARGTPFDRLRASGLGWGPGRAGLGARATTRVAPTVAGSPRILRIEDRMNIAVASVTLHLPGASSLKDKRGIVQSLMTRLRDRYNVSVAEVGEQESHRSSELGFSGRQHELRAGPRDRAERRPLHRGRADREGRGRRRPGRRCSAGSASRNSSSPHPNLPPEGEGVALA